MRYLTKILLLMRRRCADAEAGFTIIELMAAVSIIAIALLGMAYTATVGLSDVGLARQRQGGNQVANQAMEQVRGLPFATLQLGLKSSDLTGDSRITMCGSPAVRCYQGEPIVQSSNPPNVVPVVPHTNTLTVGPTAYAVSVYVTYYQGNTSGTAYRVSVVSSWANPDVRGVASSVQTQSIIYSGPTTGTSGCLSTQTHPFAGPCQPFLYGNSSVQVGQVNITGTIAGISLDHATLWTPETSSNMQVEQVSAVQGTSQASGLELQLAGQTAQLLGRTLVTSKADNDPGQPQNVYQTASYPPPSQSGGTLSQSGGGNTITLSAGAGGDQGSTTSAASALTSTYPCADRGGVTRNDAQPCGASSARLGPSLSATLSLTSGSLNLGGAALATINPPSGSSASRYAFTNRDLQHESAEPATECQATSGDGCVHSDVYRNSGSVTIGGLPSAFNVLAPLGWNGSLITINASTATASADVGIGTAAPTAASTGNISYWNGTGYTSIPIAGTSTPTSIPVSLSLPGGLVLPGVTLTLNATVTPGQRVVSDPAGGCGTCTRTQASGTTSSPVVDLTYQVVVGSATLASLTIHADLGTVLAQGSYQPAPSGA